MRKVTLFRHYVVCDHPASSLFCFIISMSGWGVLLNPQLPFFSMCLSQFDKVCQVVLFFNGICVFVSAQNVWSEIILGLNHAWNKMLLGLFKLQLDRQIFRIIFLSWYKFSIKYIKSCKVVEVLKKPSMPTLNSCLHWIRLLAVLPLTHLPSMRDWSGHSQNLLARYWIFFHTFNRFNIIFT